MKPTISKLVQPVRGCGRRKSFSFYLSSGSGSSGGILPMFVRMTPPIPINRKAHRTPLVVDGSAILAAEPEDTWLAGSSKKAQQRKEGDAWALETFGMSSTVRMATGLCKGTKDPEQAMVAILNGITWDKRILVTLRDMAAARIMDLPNMAAPYGDMVRAAQAYAETGHLSALADILAAAWRGASAAQPRHRQTVLPYLAKVMSYLGAREDTLAMLARFTPQY